MMADAVPVSGVDEVRALTQALLDCAHSGDWDGIVALEAERRTLLYDLFESESRHAEELLRTLLTDILVMDQEIMSLTQQRCDELSDWLRQVGQRRTAMKAYDSNTR